MVVHFEAVVDVWRSGQLTRHANRAISDGEATPIFTLRFGYDCIEFRLAVEHGREGEAGLYIDRNAGLPAHLHLSVASGWG